MKEHEIKDAIVRCARNNRDGIRSEILSSQIGILVFTVMKLCHDIQADGYIKFDKQHGDTFLIYETEKTGWFIAHGGYTEIYKAKRRAKMWAIPKTIWNGAKEPLSLGISLIAMAISWGSYQSTEKSKLSEDRNQKIERRLDSLIKSINMSENKATPKTSNKADTIIKPPSKLIK